MQVRRLSDTHCGTTSMHKALVFRSLCFNLTIGMLTNSFRFVQGVALWLWPVAALGSFMFLHVPCEPWVNLPVTCCKPVSLGRIHSFPEAQRPSPNGFSGIPLEVSRKWRGHASEHARARDQLGRPRRGVSLASLSMLAVHVRHAFFASLVRGLKHLAGSSQTE